ncbi:uncharacterized protein EDB91DRAFT_799075 [Suillus paluster]|uniref:uncharacterized protein n=1 Tax=Suillus paluster TaxID=48578 RepID=UPI001B863F8E|nr:uncharacterized protein EDB91DRAFT_799075 [Suillus paluster]KAG1729964.1 hypothetical protein EDB91DRAFT_799075 [Suillus paluster]
MLAIADHTSKRRKGIKAAARLFNFTRPFSLLHVYLLYKFNLKLVYNFPSYLGIMVSSPGASPRDSAALRLQPCNPTDTNVNVSSPLNPSSSCHRQSPLQSPSSAIVPPHARRPSFSFQNKLNAVPQSPVRSSDVAHRLVGLSDIQPSLRQNTAEQSRITIATHCTPTSPTIGLPVRPRSSSRSFDQSSSPPLSRYLTPSLASSPVLESSPPYGRARYSSHKRSLSYDVPAIGGGSPIRSRSSSVAHGPSLVGHRNSVLPSSPVRSGLPRGASLQFQPSSSFADCDYDGVDLAIDIKSDVTHPGHPPRLWWNLTVPWDADQRWAPAEFVCQDEPRVKYDERLKPLEPDTVVLVPSDNEARERKALRSSGVGIPEDERAATVSKSVFKSFRRYSFSQRIVVGDESQAANRQSQSLRLSGAERDGFQRAQDNVILACYSVMTRDELTAEHVNKNSTVSCIVSTLGTIANEALPVLKTILECTYDAVALVPVPFFLEASRTLLIIWEACEQLSSNRLSCLRLVERCAGMLYFVREQIEGVGPFVGKELDAAFHVFREVIFQIERFLCRISRRPMLKRFIRRAEIAKELCNCDQALMDAWLRFTATVSVNIVKDVKCLDGKVEELKSAVLEHSTTTSLAPAPPIADIETSATCVLGPKCNMKHSLPETVHCLTTTEGEIHRELPPIFPEDNLDNELQHDQFQLDHLPDFIGTARCDADVLNGLEIDRNEVVETMKAMRRQLESLRNAFSRTPTVVSDGTLAEMELLDAGIVSMSKLHCMQVRGDTGNFVAPWELPSWTITRYEVDRFEMIGQGSFSRVYAGSWRDRVVAIKVLHDFTPATAFRREVQLWRRLRHPHVVRMFGASSAQGSKPWFIVSELYERGSLVEWLLAAARDDYATPRGNEEHLFRLMRQIARGMEYLHAEGVVHGDLKCANIFMNRAGSCAIADFGQSELKDEAYRRSGCHQLKGTPRWKAPELLDGAPRPTMQADVYAFAICCVEILNMGDIPYGTRDDEDVKRIVLEHDARPEISSSPLASIVLPVIHCCWARDPPCRSSFSMAIAMLLSCRDSVFVCGADGCTPGGPANSPTVSFPDRPSPDLRVPATPPREIHSWLAHTSSMSAGYNTLSAFGSETGDTDSGSQDIPESSMSSETSCCEELDAFDDASTPVDNTTESILSEMSMNAWAQAMQNERRYRLLAKDTHGYGELFTTPLWYPSPVEVGAVGYVSKPDGEFITLCNAIKIGGKKKAEGDVTKCIPPLLDYGSTSIRKTHHGHKHGSSALSGIFNRGGGHKEEHVSHRQAFTVHAGKKTAGVYAERYERQNFSNESLPAATRWFKDNIRNILQEYAPHHSIQKEDVFFVTGTISAPDYALFVTDPISSGEAYFNVFASRKSHRPWGTFTVKSDGTESFPTRTTFTSKVSRSHQTKTLDTILLARLRFAPDAEEPTLQ